MLTFYCVYFNDAANKISGCEIVRDLINARLKNCNVLKIAGSQMLFNVLVVVFVFFVVVVVV